MGTLTGKNAVVTGSTSGIGLAYRALLPGRRGRDDQRLGRARGYRGGAGRDRDHFGQAVHSAADMTKPRKSPP